MKMTPDVEGANVAKKLAFTPSPSSFKRTIPLTQLNKRSESQFRTPGSSSNYFRLSPNEVVLPKFLKCKFMPTKKMFLRPEEVVVCHYIFRRLLFPPPCFLFQPPSFP
ncbi:hypothetical protein P8452_32404 [Trifolium repens]|nr:hypothetical protein P8452_32404 [Trifolium repens]